jgi:RimJ/RimL family protein N-acetyltransferase
VYKLLSRQFRQEWISYGLRRDLEVAHEAPAAKIPVVVRELQDGDIPALFHDAPELLTRKERLEIANRLAHIAEQIPRCFVAIDERENRPCYVQWLMTAQHNEQIQRFFRGRFPLLKNNEALLENAYTPVRYRGQGIMSAAMSQIAERAIELGGRYVITFVLQDNAASLKGCARAGFFPYTVRRDSHLLFRLIRRRRFIALGEQHTMRSA